MARDLRYIPPGSLVEVSCRCLQGRFLLRPGKLLNALIVGVLVLALRGTGISAHAFTALSNHWHLLVTVPSTGALARAMRFFQGNVSKEVGRIHRWRGRLWASRYKVSIVDSDEASQVARLRYVLSQGVKEGLVWAAGDWPGVNSVRALLRGEPLRGTWIDRTRQWAARRRKGADASDEAHQSATRTAPCPSSLRAHLPEDERRARVADLVRSIEDEGRAKHAADGTRPLGPRRVRKVHPHHAPEKVAWSPQPRILARKPLRRRVLWEAISAVVAAYRDAADRLKQGDRSVRFPEGTFPPGLPYVPRVADLLPGG